VLETVLIQANVKCGKLKHVCSRGKDHIMHLALFLNFKKQLLNSITESISCCSKLISLIPENQLTVEEKKQIPTMFYMVSNDFHQISLDERSIIILILFVALYRLDKSLRASECMRLLKVASPRPCSTFLCY
jgi:hypothetical protein